MQDDINKYLGVLSVKRPLVHCITNQVTVNLVANALLALGASPVMSNSIDEVAQVAAQASALYLNIGTLSQPGVVAMLAAGRAANRHGVPVVLDPVGAGFTGLRNNSCLSLLNDIKITAIRGNASEIIALANMGSASRGVDSMHSVEEARVAADELARKYGLIVALTGKRDYVTDGRYNQIIDGGHELMAVVSGMGCAVGALLAAWLTVDGTCRAAANALALAGVCGSRAAASAQGPGSFVGAWLDEIYLASRGGG